MWSDREHRLIDSINAVRKLCDNNNIRIYTDSEYSITGWDIDDVESELNLYPSPCRGGGDLYRITYFKDIASLEQYEMLYTGDYVVKLKRTAPKRQYQETFEELEHWSKDFFNEWQRQLEVDRRVANGEIENPSFVNGRHDDMDF